MGIGSWWHWVIVLAIVLLLFGGGGKIPRLMRDMGEGITAFRKGLKKNEGEGQGQGEGEQGASGNPALQPSTPANTSGTSAGEANTTSTAAKS